MAPNEKSTYFQYHEGIDTSVLRLGNMAFDYANPKMKRPYVHTVIATNEFSDLATADEREKCFMVFQKGSTFNIRLGLQDVLGFDTSNSKSSDKFVFGANGSVEELRSPDDFFEKVVLTSVGARSWLKSRLTIVRKLQISKKFSKPSLWLLTGLYKITDATYYSVSKASSSFGVAGNIPIIDPSGLAALLQLSVGSEIKLASGVVLNAGAKILGSKVWAAQWQKINAKYLAADKWNEGVINQLRLLDVNSTGRGGTDSTVVAELSLGGDTTIPSKDVTEDEEISRVEYWDTFEEELKDFEKELPTPFFRPATSEVAHNRFALLIGVDFYMPGEARVGMNFPNLKGCVEDVMLVKQYLCTRHHLDDEHIEVLTATRIKDSEKPKELSSKWPTYENILKAFKKITKEAEKGDFVYVHYSGHGARAVTIFDDSIHLKPKGDWDEVLVPTDIAQENGRYIRDVEIAYLLQDMAKKGLYVTVVFDCCHSGGATRGKTTRGIHREDTNKLDSDISSISLEKLAVAWKEVQSKRTRGGEVKHWLLEPDGYAFLAACLDTQEAHELLFGDKIYGVLTRLLINALDKYKDSPMEPTYDMLHSDIKEGIKKYSSQIPVLGGEGDRSFFGKERLQPFYTAALSNVPENVQVGNIVQLNVGIAHGISEGAEFDVWAMTGFFLSDSGTLMAHVSDYYNPLARLRIKNVHGITSDAILYETGQGTVRTGCQAVQMSNGFLVLVKLMPTVAIDLQNGLDEALKSSTKPSIRLIRLMADDEKGPPSFQVDVNGSAQYEIRKIPENSILAMPGLHIDSLGASEKLLRRLAHLTNYFNVRDVTNDQYHLDFSVKVGGRILETTPRPRTRRRLLSQSSATSTEELVDNQNVYEVVEGDYILLLVENSGDARIYITLLNLSPTWSVTQIYPRGSTAFEPIEPNMVLEIPIQMSTEDDPYGNIDIFKVYASTETTSFHSLQLPTIDEDLSLKQLQAAKTPTSKIEPKHKSKKGRGGDVPSSDDEALPIEKLWDTAQVSVRTLPKT